MNRTQSRTDWQAFRQEFRPYLTALAATSSLNSIGAIAELAVVSLLATLGTSALAGPAKTTNLPILGALSQRQLAMALVVMVLIRGTIQLVIASVKQRMLFEYEQSTRSGFLSSFLGAEWATQSSMESTEIYNALFNYLNQARGALKSVGDVSGYAVNFAVMLIGSFAAGGFWTLAIIAATGALAVLLRPLIGASRRAASDARSASRQYVGHMIETIALAREVRVFAVDRCVDDRNRAGSIELADANRRADLASARLSAFYTSAVYLVAAIGIAAVVLADLSNPAPYITVVLLLYRGMGYGQSLQSAYQTLVSSEPALLWLQKTRRELTQHALPTGGATFVAPADSIEFSSVSFAYPDGTAALKDVDFTLRKGVSVGVVGPSGSGKSTLIQLLLRLRTPTDGQILVNDQDLATLDPDSWFGHVVLVPQEARLANVTVLENVLWFRQGLTRDDAVRALRAAHVYDEITQLPEGLDTIVGEQGGRLSGGQRQRVCIARALAGSPDVMILDEPTSALDLVSEERIRETLASLRDKVTLVIVAHRLSTLRICNEVVVLRNGEIEAFGPRSELEANEFFAEAVRLSKLN